MRHAPVDAALAPWLHSIIGEDVDPLPLQTASFWPRYPATADDGVTTEPDVVVALRDPRRCVIIEVKPGHGGHTLAQIEREIIDVVANTPGVESVDAILVSADRAPTPEFDVWSEAMLANARLPARLHHSSFADLAGAIRKSSKAHHWLTPYASDVWNQLAREGLAGYEGAPMLDETERLPIAQYVEGFNLILASCREFFLALHADPMFRSLGLVPSGTGGYRMFRNAQ